MRVTNLASFFHHLFLIHNHTMLIVFSRCLSFIPFNSFVLSFCKLSTTTNVHHFFSIIQRFSQSKKQCNLEFIIHIIHIFARPLFLFSRSGKEKRGAAKRVCHSPKCCGVGQEIILPALTARMTRWRGEERAPGH